MFNYLRKIKGFKVFDNGYRVNANIVRVFSVIVMVYMLFSMYSVFTHDRFYIYNDNPGIVPNPFYVGENEFSSFDNKQGLIPDGITSMEFLPAGFEAGYKHSSIVSNAPVYGLLILAFGALLNHLLFNKKKQRKFYEL